MRFFSIPLLCLLIAMFSIQFGASLAKQLFPIIGSSATSAMRLLFAALILLAIWRPWRTKFTKESYPILFCYGFSLGFMNLLFYYSLERIPLGVAVALEFVGPLSISLLQSKKPVDFLWALLAAAGIYLILPMADVSVQQLDTLGVVLALAAGAFWALYIYFGEKASRTGNIGAVTAWGMFIAAVFALPFSFIYSSPTPFSFEILKLGLLVAVLSSAIPYSLEMVALKNIPTKTFGILMSLEPATAALMGYLNLKEVLSSSQVAAVFCIIAASMGSSLFSRRKN